MRHTCRTHAAIGGMVGALVLSACGFEGGSADGSEGGGGNLVIDLPFAPAANFALETDDAIVLSRVGCLETLVRYDARAGELVPELATEWKQVRPRVWDFTLREDIAFQDGTPLDAKAAASALNRALEVEAPARAFTPEVITSVQATNESTVRVTTPKPSALVPFRLASLNTGIMAPDAYAGSGVDPVENCTGPFTPVEVSPEQSMTLERNEDYWGQPAKLETVEARFVPDGQTRATQVRSGEADVAQYIPSSSLPQLESASDVQVMQEPAPRTTGLYFNHSKPPFDDPQVRKAVRMALDLKSIAANVYDGAVQPAIGPFAPNEPWAPSDVEPVAQDLETARQMLRQAGYGPGELQVELLGYTERPEFEDLASVIQANLQQIGVDVSVRIRDYAAIEPALLNGTYDFSLLSRNHLIDIADPMGFLTSDYTCQGGYNISHFCNPTVDQMIRSARSESDESARAQIYAEVASLLQREAVTAFLVHEQASAAVSTDVPNYTVDPYDRYAVTPDLTISDS